jgi:hypothetical protein
MEGRHDIQPFSPLLEAHQGKPARNGAANARALQGGHTRCASQNDCLRSDDLFSFVRPGYKLIYERQKEAVCRQFALRRWTTGLGHGATSSA